MRRFAALYAALDASTGTDDKVDALVAYLAQAPAADAAWAVYFLAGGRPRQTVPTAVLRATATAAAGLPDWLFDASYQAVGDLAETIAQVLPPPASASDLGLAHWVEQRLLPLRGTTPEQQAESLRAWWDELPAEQRFLLVKLIGGGFRVGVSRLLVQRALARHAALPPALVAQRMMGYTDARSLPTAQRLLALLATDQTATADSGQPYPFFLAHAIERDGPDIQQQLGDRNDWLAEWKYDGIRAQLVRRAGQVWLWSRGEELVTERFPEVAAMATQLPDGTVLDGELLVWQGSSPAAFNRLQQRITRKTLSRKLLAEQPVLFMAYDLLEWQGQDLRAQPQQQRRQQLEALMQGLGLYAEVSADEAAVADHLPSQVMGLRLSPLLPGTDWASLAALRADSRSRGVEGLMLKHRLAAYGSGRTKRDGAWWKWKVDPMQVDGVLIYAQSGHGRRSGVYTDYTFAVWSRPPMDAAEADSVVQAIAERRPAEPGALQLVAFAKAYSGLTDEEFKQVDREIRAHTLEKFGPVRSVRPTMVFELGFEGINRSPRHKSGIALRFPRILRWRHDKLLHQADSLTTLTAMLEGC